MEAKCEYKYNLWFKYNLTFKAIELVESIAKKMLLLSFQKICHKNWDLLSADNIYSIENPLKSMNTNTTAFIDKTEFWLGTRIVLTS